MVDDYPRDTRGHGQAVLALGVDVGTTNTKVALVAISAGEPGCGAVRVVTAAGAPTPDDASTLVATAVGLVRSVLADAPRPPDVVGLASMAETGVPIDADGEPLCPFLRWDGHRACAEAKALAADLGRDALFTTTGVRPSAKVPLATLAWLRRNEPDVWLRMRHWAGAADIVCLAMTSRLATDHTLAGRTMAYRLPGPDGVLPATFDADLLAAVGLYPEQLPAIVGPREVAGRVTASAFVGAGLLAGTPVVVAGHDHAVGAYAAGVGAPGDVADSLGTAEAVITVLARSPEPAAVAAAGMSLVRTVTGQHEALMAACGSAGAMIAWWLATMVGNRPAADVFADVDRLPAGPTGVLVLPYLAGRQAPAPDPAAEVVIIGRTAGHGRAQLTRALLEGLSLQARWMLAEQARLGGTDLAGSEVAVLGGAVSANPTWMGVKAAVTPAPLRLVGITQPVAAGAALVAAERAGLLAAGVVRLPGCRSSAAGARVRAGCSPGAAYDQMFREFVTAALAVNRNGEL